MSHSLLASVFGLIFLSLVFRDIMNRSDSDSALPLSHSESRSLYDSRQYLLSSKLQQQHAVGFELEGGAGGGLEKSSSLGELRGGSGAILSSACSTRSLCVTSESTDGPVVFSSSAASGSSGGSRGAVLQPPVKRSLRKEEEEERGEESETSSSRRRNAFNKIFKKKQGRH